MYGYLSSFDIGSKMMEFGIDMFIPGTKLVNSCHFDRTTVILKNATMNFGIGFGDGKPITFHLFQYLHHVNCFQDNPMYSLSVELNAISVCSWDFQTIGQPAYMMKYPCREHAVSRSLNASSLSQLPAKSAST